MAITLWLVALAVACLICQGHRTTESTTGSHPIKCSSRNLGNQRLDETKLNMDDVKTRRVDTLTGEDCVLRCCSFNDSAKHTCAMAVFNSNLTTENCLLVYCKQSDDCGRNALDVGGNELLETFLVGKAVELDYFPKDYSTPKTLKRRKGSGGGTTGEDKVGSLSESTTSVPTSSYRPPTSGRVDDSAAPSVDDEDELSTASTKVTAQRPYADSTTEKAWSATAGLQTTPVPDLDADKDKHAVPRKGVSDGFRVLLLHKPKNSSLTPPEGDEGSSPMFMGLQPPNSTKGNTQIENPTNESELSSERGSLTESTFATANVVGVPDAVAFYPTIGTPAATFELDESDSARATNAADNKKVMHNQTETVFALTQTKTGKHAPTGNAFAGLANKSSIFVSGNRTASLESPASDSAAQPGDELTIQQSVYLIASLIIGFIVLLTVIGLVMRHVHGVWERRHYQRMDFLIDGMYNNM